MTADLPVTTLSHRQDDGELGSLAGLIRLKMFRAKPRCKKYFYMPSTELRPSKLVRVEQSRFVICQHLPREELNGNNSTGDPHASASWATWRSSHLSPPLKTAPDRELDLLGIFLKRIRPICISLFVLLSLFTSRVADAAIDKAQVSAWLQEQIDGQFGLEKYPNLYFRLTVTMPPQWSAAELAAVQKEVEGKPDHPKRFELQAEILRVKNNGERTIYTVWRNDANNWRVNSDSPEQPDIRFNDVYAGPDLAWQMNPRQLTVIDPREGWPHEYELNTYLNAPLKYFLDLSAGGLARPKVAEARLKDVSLQGTSWSCIVEQPNYALRVAGTWNEQLQRGFVSDTTVVKSTRQPDSVGRKRTFGTWNESSIPGLWIASKVTESNSNGRVFSEAQVEEIRPQKGNELAGLKQLPDPAGSDPIRGQITFFNVRDYRPGVGKETYPRHVGAAPTVLEINPKETDRLRTVGWVVLGLLVVGLIGYRVRGSFRVA